MGRIAVVTDERLGAQLAGPAIRALQMATHLGAEHEVRLRSTSGGRIDPAPVDAQVDHGESAVDQSHVDVDVDVDGAVDHVGRAVDHGDGVALTSEGANELADWADVIVFGGFLLVRFPELRAADTVLVADLYDPLHLEVLAARVDPGDVAQPSAALHRLDTTLDAIQDQLGRADLVLCATERQRDLWLGHLGAAGRLNPAMLAHDPTLRSLIARCPFGVDPGPPKRDGPGVRELFPVIDPNDPIVVWGGGVHDWFDPESAIDAIALVAGHVPGVRLVFLGGPHPTHGRSTALVRAQSHARDLGLDGSTVLFNDAWVPFGRRHNFLLDADVAISVHHHHLETDFSYRTRLLDYLWCGLPVVTGAGDELAQQIHETGAGVAVEPGDTAALERAILQLLVDGAENARARTASLKLADDHRWSSALAPMLEFCRSPERAPDLLDPSTARLVARRSALPSARRRDLDRAGRLLRAGPSGAVDLLGRLRRRVGVRSRKSWRG